MSHTWKSWLNKLRPARRTALRRPRPKPTRLRAEPLEDRTVPAVFNVTTTVDMVNANDGLLSLREAVLAANATFDADTINLPAGTYTLSLTGADENAAATGDLDVSNNLTIQGVGADSTIVNGNQTDRIFDLIYGTLSLSALTVRNGSAVGSAAQARGGGIQSVGTLTLTDCLVTACEARTNDVNAGTGAEGATGGGLYCSGFGAVTLIRTTVSNNQAIGGTASGQSNFGGDAWGGGLYRIGGSLSLTDSKVTDNQALGGPTTSTGGTKGGFASGGGIYYQVQNSIYVPDGSLFEVGNLTVVSSTIGGNRAVGGSASGAGSGHGGDASGGGVGTSAPGTFTDSAVVNNQAIGGSASNVSGAATGGDARGGGISSSILAYATGWLSLANSTISDNRAAGGTGSAGWNGVGGDGIAGGVYTQGECSITNCTLTLNTAVGGTGSYWNGTGTGGGIIASGPDLIVGSSIVAGNVAASAPDINRPSSQGAATTLGNNLIGLGSGVSGFTNGVNGDQVGGPTPIDPRLGPLANNGGRTPTHALLPDSPAIDRGSNSSGRPLDQRGPGFVRSFGPSDVGALERTEAGVPTATTGLFVIGDPSIVSVTFGVTFTDDEAVAVASIRTGVITIAGPNGFTVTSPLNTLDDVVDGPIRTASFTFTPPGGSWDAGDAGRYTVSVAPGVTDTVGRAVPAGPLGSFLVDLPTTFRVSNTNDSGPGSLRQAVLDANVTSAADTILFDQAVFSSPRTIALTSGMLNVHAPLTVNGPGAALLTISGGNSSRIFYLNAPGQMPVKLSELTFTGGRASGRGGAILNVDEALTIDNCVFRSNTASEAGGAVGLGRAVSNLIIRGSVFTNNTAADGGALFVSNGSTLVLDASTLDGNKAVPTASSTGSGGAIYFGIPTGPSTFDISNSTFANNTAALGGAVYVTSLKSRVTNSIVNSTISGNAATVDGGAIVIGTLGSLNGVLAVQSSTITENRAANGTGGGLLMQGTQPGKFVITSSVISRNTAMTAPDVASAGPVDVTYSAVGSAIGFTPSAASGNNLPFGTDILLGPLADNGGPTRTHALSAGSPAINAGSNPAGLTTDQRGP